MATRANAYTEANIETALCLWEALLDRRDDPAIKAKWDELGTCSMRHSVIALIDDCEAEWERDRKLGTETEPYDWEHCPAFLDRNLARLTD